MSLRPLACDFRRLRFSRSASFSRSCREFRAGWLSPLSLSSVIVDLFEWGSAFKTAFVAAGDRERLASLLSEHMVFRT
jgi:hypothetical protein